MHDTVFGGFIQQRMGYQEGDRECEGSTRAIKPELIRKPKGMKRTLQERGLWKDSLKKQCGSKKANFTETMEQYEARIADRCCALLETVIKAAGQEVIFYLKFHRGLNYVGHYWLALKRYARDNCKYLFAAYCFERDGFN